MIRTNSWPESINHPSWRRQRPPSDTFHLKHYDITVDDSIPQISALLILPYVILKALGTCSFLTFKGATSSPIQDPAVMISRSAVYVARSVTTRNEPVLESSAQLRTVSPSLNSAPLANAAATWAWMHRSEARIPPSG